MSPAEATSGPAPALSVNLLGGSLTRTSVPPRLYFSELLSAVSMPIPALEGQSGSTSRVLLNFSMLRVDMQNLRVQAVSVGRMIRMPPRSGGAQARGTSESRDATGN